jgi:hypothetical protein
MRYNNNTKKNKPSVCEMEKKKEGNRKNIW